MVEIYWLPGVPLVCMRFDYRFLLEITASLTVNL